jgi:hypothetical protein
MRSQPSLFNTKGHRAQDEVLSICFSNFRIWNWDTIDLSDETLSDSSRVIRRITKSFPSLPRLFCVTLDPIGRPMYRWATHYFVNHKPSRFTRYLELRISFKSSSFVRITIETLFNLAWEPTFDGVEMMLGFPMYLDLTVASGVEMLYKVVGSYVSNVDPIFDRIDSVLPGFCKMIENNSNLLNQTDDSILRASEAFLSAANLAATERSVQFIKTTLKYDEMLDQSSKKFPKTNVVACLRFVRRKLNEICLLMDPIDFQSSIPFLRDTQAYLREQSILKSEEERCRDRASKRYFSVYPIVFSHAQMPCRD